MYSKFFCPHFIHLPILQDFVLLPLIFDFEIGKIKKYCSNSELILGDSVALRSKNFRINFSGHEVYKKSSIHLLDPV